MQTTLYHIYTFEIYKPWYVTDDESLEETVFCRYNIFLDAFIVVNLHPKCIISIRNGQI